MNIWKARLIILGLMPTILAFTKWSIQPNHKRITSSDSQHPLPARPFRHNPSIHISAILTPFLPRPHREFSARVDSAQGNHRQSLGQHSLACQSSQAICRYACSIRYQYVEHHELGFALARLLNLASWQARRAIHQDNAAHYGAKTPCRFDARQVPSRQIQHEAFAQNNSRGFAVPWFDLSPHQTHLTLFVNDPHRRLTDYCWRRYLPPPQHLN